MAVTLFDPQLPKPPCYTQTLRLYLLQNYSYGRLKFYIAGIGNFAFFCEKWWKLLKQFIRIRIGRRCYRNTFTDPLPTVLACMLPKLHAFKVLFYAESVGVVTSSHVTKMAVTPLDPQLPITPYCTQTLRLYLLQNRSYCRLNFYMAGIGNFAFFCEKQ